MFKAVQPAVAEVGKLSNALDFLDNTPAFKNVAADARKAQFAINDTTLAANDLEKATKRSGDGIVGGFKGVAGKASSSGAEAASGFVEGFGGPIAALGTRGGPIGLALAATAGLGLIAGGVLAKNVLAGLDQIQGQANVAAKIGITPEQMKPIADAAAKAYAANFGESIAENMDTARVAIQSGLLDAGSSQNDTRKVVEQLTTVSDVLGEEIPSAARAAQQAIRTGLVGNATEAFDLFVKAQQNGLNVSEDFLDTVAEYGTQFRKLGIDGTEAFGLISQAVKGGARDTDVAADAIKEFSIRAVDGSDTSAEAFEALGLNADQMTGKFAAGGDSAKAAFDQVLDAIRAIDDPVKRSAVQVGLFGTQAEDLGAALNGLDLSTAVQQFGAVDGAAARAAETMGGTATSSIESARRSIEVSLGSVQQSLGEAFGPHLQEVATWISENQGDITGFFTTLGEVAVTAAEYVVQASGQLAGSIGEIIAPIGDVLGAVNKFQAWQADLRGDTETANQLRTEAEGFFAWGESLQEFADKASRFSADGIRESLREVAQDAKIADGNMDLLANGITTLPNGQVVLKDDTPEAIERVRQLGYDVQRLPTGQLSIRVAYLDQDGRAIPPSMLGVSQRQLDRTNYRVGPPSANGGVLPGYSPGIDNMLVPLSGGEGILIPEAVRALGPGFVYGLNAMFRPGLPRGFHRGGVFGGFEGGGVVPGMSPMAADIAVALASAVGPMIGLLAEIRDLLRPQTDDLATLAGDSFSTAHLGTGATPGPMSELLPKAGLADEANLTDAAKFLNRAVTQAFPQLSEIGGWRASDPYPDHPSGRALDIMVPNKEVGDQINAWLHQNAATLGLDSTLWQQMRTPVGGDPSLMEDRGSPTQNHMDHIHALVRDGVLPAGGLTSPGVSDSSSNPLAGATSPVPVYIVAGPGGGTGQLPDGAQTAIDAATGAAKAVLPQLTDDVLKAALGVGNRDLPTDPAALRQLLDESNPQALSTLAGYQVGDYNRTGSQGQANNLLRNTGPAFDARGQVFSDTSALLDRTFSSLQAQIEAQTEQTLDALSQVKDQLTERFLVPALKTGVSSGIDAISAGTSAAIGQQMGQAAAGPIASAVAAAIPPAPAPAAPMALGGPVFGGVPGRDSVPALLMPGEHVFTTADVQRMGGQAGVYAFRRALAAGAIQGFATGGGVNVNDTVGAEFFGVSQIPIIGMIVNMLVRILLAVLGVNIEARDTLAEVTDEFREFRGEFQAFDASGRLMNDTSALTERSGSSEDVATQERVRILTVVIQALIEYIIEKVIVPMAKAVANSLLNAAGSAASSAIGTSTFGAGGILGGLASSLITGVGGAGVDVIAEIASEIAVNFFDVLIDLLGDGLLGLFPDLMNAIFSGGLIEQFIAGPINMLLAPFEALFGALSGGVGALFAPLLGLLGGIASFDEGGVANGMGLMPKATIQPERVLSPRETVAFEELVRNNFGANSGGNRTEIHAPMNFYGTDPSMADRMHNKLSELI
ncbi:hypothetical protein BH11ACT6_BH11ACT6_53490 [soil metagenome]